MSIAPDIKFELSGSAIRDLPGVSGDYGADFHASHNGNFSEQFFKVAFGPVDDTEEEGLEEAKLTLVPGPGYVVGTHNSYSFYIEDDETEAVDPDEDFFDDPIYCQCSCPVCPTDAANTVGPGDQQSVNKMSGGLEIGLPSTGLRFSSPTESQFGDARSLMLSNLGAAADWNPIIEITGSGLTAPMQVSIASQLSFSNAEAMSTSPKLFGFALNHGNLTSGDYQWLLKNRPGGTVVGRGTKSIINRNDSEFGNGWYPEYLSKLVFDGTSGFSWVQGSNNSFYYSYSTGFEDGERGFSTVGTWSGGTQITTRDGDVHRFNATGMLVEKLDRNGNRTLFSYADKDGDSIVDEIVSMTRPDGSQVTFQYSGSRVQQIIHPGGYSLTLVHDSANRVTALREPTVNGITPEMTVSYDTLGRITSYKNFNGFTWSFTYDEFNGLQSMTQPDGGLYTFTSFRRAAWSTTAIPAFTTDPTVSVRAMTTFGRSPKINLMERGRWTTPTGKVYTFTTNKFGDLLYLRTPLGFATEWDRNRDGLVIKETGPDPDGVGPETAYISRFHYDNFGRRIAHELPTGSWASWQYISGRAHPVRFVDFDGTVTNFDLDNNGNVLAETLAIGLPRTKTYTYTTAPALGDGLNKVFAGQLTSIVDEAGLETTITYASSGLSYTIDQLDKSITNHFDIRGNRISETTALGQTTTWNYDALNRLTKIVLPPVTGETTPVEYLYSYNSSAPYYVLAVTDPLNRKQNYTFDFRGNRLTESISHASSGGSAFGYAFSYDLDGNLITQTNPLGGVTNFIHDANGRLISQTDPAVIPHQPAVWQFAWDALDRPTLSTDPTGFQQRTIYELFGEKIRTSTSFDGGWAETITLLDPRGRVHTVTDANAGVTEYYYDQYGNIVEIHQPQDSAGQRPIWSFTYNEVGQVLTSTAPAHQSTWDVTLYNYDDYHRLTSIEYPTTYAEGSQQWGYQETFAYDLGDRLISAGATGRPTSQMTYDNRDRLKTLTNADPDGTGPITARTTSYVYNLADQPLTINHPTGAVESFVYDNLGRIQTHSTAGRSYNYSYDAAGNVVSETNPMGHATTFTYNPRNQLTKVLPPLSGDGYRYSYDAAGRQTELKDPLNIVTTTEYEDGRVSQSIDGKGATTQYSYDAAGNLIGLTDPASNTTTWVYDKLRRPVQETNQLGKSRTFKYDLNGNLVERVDRTGKKMLYTYDKLNQPIKETWVNDTTGVGEYNYSYQTLGKIQTAHSGAVSTFDRDQVSFAYTADGRLKQETQQWKEITSELATVNYEYLGTQSGPATVLTNYAGTTQLINSYSYNSLGEVTQIKQESPQATVARFRSVDYSRNLLGQTTQLTRKHGMTSVPNTLAPVTNYSYDGADRIQNIQHINGNAPLASYAYTYDLASRITSINSLLDGVVTYAYDNANQVTQATYGTPLPNPLNKRVTGAIENSAGNITSEVFAYDSNGNNTSLAIGSNNQMTGDGAYTYTYDDEGRPISRSSGTITTTYAWDHRGRLVSVMEDHGGTPVAGAVDGVSVEYRYDAFDRRIFKDVGQIVWVDMCVVAICQPGVTMLVPQHAPGAQRYYVYDGQHIAVELLNITDDGSASGDVAKRFMHGASIDEVLGEEHLGQFQWTFGDHLGTIRDSLTISGSSTHYVYSTFGQLLTGSALTFGYTGRETDSDTLLADNWMYYRARYYDSHTGRFVSQDPIGFAAGDTNLYRYVGNSPTNATDPSGLKKVLGISFSEDNVTQIAATYTDWCEDSAHIDIDKSHNQNKVGNSVDSKYEQKKNDKKQKGHKPGKWKQKAVPNFIDWQKAMKDLDELIKAGEKFDTIVFTGHGSPGWMGGVTLADLQSLNSATPTDAGRFIQKLNQVLNSGGKIDIRHCSVAKHQVGKDFLQEMSNVTGASVTGIDDWYAIWPHGTEWTAQPGGNGPTAGTKHPSYPGFPNPIRKYGK